MRFRIIHPLLPAVNGKWHLPAKSKSIPDPYNGDKFVQVPDPQVGRRRHE